MTSKRGLIKRVFYGVVLPAVFLSVVLSGRLISRVVLSAVFYGVVVSAVCLGVILPTVLYGVSVPYEYEHGAAVRVPRNSLLRLKRRCIHLCLGYIYFSDTHIYIYIG